AVAMSGRFMEAGSGWNDVRLAWRKPDMRACLGCKSAVGDRRIRHAGSEELEQHVQAGAERRGAGDDHDGDQRRDQPVLDGRSAIFFMDEVLQEWNQLHGQFLFLRLAKSRCRRPSCPTRLKAGSCALSTCFHAGRRTRLLLTKRL